MHHSSVINEPHGLLHLYRCLNEATWPNIYDPFMIAYLQRRAWHCVWIPQRKTHVELLFRMYSFSVNAPFIDDCSGSTCNRRSKCLRVVPKHAVFQITPACADGSLLKAFRIRGKTVAAPGVIYYRKST